MVTFKNGKDVPVAVSEMRVEFYKGASPSKIGRALPWSSWTSTTGSDRSAR